MLVSWTIATAARGELRGEGNLLQRAPEFTQAEQEHTLGKVLESLVSSHICGVGSQRYLDPSPA